MRFVARSPWFGHTLGLLLASTAGSAWAATPSASDALKLSPVQRDVEYDIPKPADTAGCTIKAEQFSGRTGWVVRNPNGQILRRFVDTNGDNVVDQWSYFTGGLKVYRDIDRNFNGKADEYRWLNTAGSRWGFDQNEDGKIDTWKVISAEEVGAEVVRAVADRDSNRFARLLITADEMKSLGMSAAQAEKLAQKVKEAPDRFQSFLASTKSGIGVQQVSESKPKWVNFGGSLPGLVPKGTNGSTKNILVYENVMAMVERGEKHDQIPIGTMVQVGTSWRLIDAPRKPAEGQQELAANDGFFFPSPLPKGSESTAGNDSTPDGKLQALMADLEKLDEQLRRAGRDEQAALQAKRADMVEQVADASTGDNREMWLRQMADTIMASVQSGDYPNGVQRLAQLKEKLAKNSADDALVGYVEFRQLQADYGQQLNSPKPKNFETIQKWWLENLEKYITAHPKGDDTVEALMQLGIAQEFAGDEDQAKKWYGKIVSGFPQAAAAKKAAGAVTRLDCVGKPIALSGTTPEGKTVNLAQFRGKVVVIQYWATTSDLCTNDMANSRSSWPSTRKTGWRSSGSASTVRRPIWSPSWRRTACLGRTCTSPAGSTAGWPTRWAS